jgi:hypothetical protein
MGAAQNDWIDAKDLHHVLIDTRNLEVNLLWQRTNYFLALNSAIVLAFFDVKGSLYVRTLALIALLSSVLWLSRQQILAVLLAGRLGEFEEHQILPRLDFFSAGQQRKKELVEKGLAAEDLGLLPRYLYNSLAKPSRSVYL